MIGYQTAAQKEQAIEAYEQRRLREQEEEEQHQQDIIDEASEKERVLAMLRHVAGWAGSNGHSFEFARAEYEDARNKRRRAECDQALSDLSGGTANYGFKISKCERREADILERAIMSMVGVCTAAAKSLEIDDAEASRFLDASEWLLARAENGLTEEETELLLQVI